MSALVPAPPLALPWYGVAREFFRVLSWAYLERERHWHGYLKLHAHLGCCVLARWRAGGFAKDHEQAGKRGPPDPPRAVIEVYQPGDVPRALRCHFCWPMIPRPGISSPGVYWHPETRDPYNIYASDGLWHCTPAQVRWTQWQFRVESRLWLDQIGGVYEREVRSL